MVKMSVKLHRLCYSLFHSDFALLITLATLFVTLFAMGIKDVIDVN